MKSDSDFSHEIKHQSETRPPPPPTRYRFPNFKRHMKEMKKDMVDFESALSVMIDKFAVIDDVEDFIMEHHGYPMVLSADKVRDIAYRRFPYLAEEGHDELQITGPSLQD
jgi:hypothetical protein